MNHLKLRLLFTLIFPLTFCAAKAQTPIGATDLKCEYLYNPIGSDNPHPRLTWRLNDARQHAKQTAYRILVGTSPAELTKGNIWNTGWLTSDAQLVTYAGSALKPFTKYYWRVDVADGNKVKYIGAKLSSFETGMMGMANWRGKWIMDTADMNLKPAPYFRKEFS